MYAVTNFKTKKALKEQVDKGVLLRVFHPGLGVGPRNGAVSLEGPHYPAPHTWYAQATLKDGYIIKVK